MSSYLRSGLPGRFFTSTLVALTKIFCAGVSWQMWGLLADYWIQASNHQQAPFFTPLTYSILTGLGDSLGVMVGMLLFNAVEYYVLNKPFSWPAFFPAVGALMIGCFVSGGFWQWTVDQSIDVGGSFNSTMVTTGTVCGMLFLAFYTLGRAVCGLPRDTWNDFTLSLSCASASAFFVGTDLRFPDNWLQSIVGERDGNAIDCLKAGISTAMGFLAMQVVLCLVLPYGWLWSDEIETEPGADDGLFVEDERDNQSSNYAKLSSKDSRRSIIIQP